MFSDKDIPDPEAVGKKRKREDVGDDRGTKVAKVSLFYHCCNCLQLWNGMITIGWNCNYQVEYSGSFTISPRANYLLVPDLLILLLKFESIVMCFSRDTLTVSSCQASVILFSVYLLLSSANV